MTPLRGVALISSPTTAVATAFRIGGRALVGSITFRVAARVLRGTNIGRACVDDRSIRDAHASPAVGSASPTTLVATARRRRAALRQVTSIPWRAALGGTATWIRRGTARRSAVGWRNAPLRGGATVRRRATVRGRRIEFSGARCGEAEEQKARRDTRIRGGHGTHVVRDSTGRANRRPSGIGGSLKPTRVRTQPRELRPAASCMRAVSRKVGAGAFVP